MANPDSSKNSGTRSSGKAKEESTEKRSARTQPRVNWDDRNMQTSYANVVNAASTREEVILLFGTNQSWKGLEDEVDVHLSNRIILNPYAAKRLALLLGGVVAQYEKRFGPLGLEAQDTKNGK